MVTQQQIQKADHFIKELVNKSKATHRKVPAEGGGFTWETTEPQIRLFGLPERRIVSGTVEVHYKVLKGWIEDKAAKTPDVEAKLEVF